MIHNIDWPQALRGCLDVRVGNFVLPFLNKLHSRRSIDIVPDVSAAIRDLLPDILLLGQQGLESLDLANSAFDTAMRAFDRLVLVNGVSSTTASKILTSLKPNLFVMWDPDIRKSYCDPLPDSGATYRFYLEQMHKVSLRITRVALIQHGIQNPAESLSAELRENRIRNCNCEFPTLPFAKFINDYNWLNFSISCKAQVNI